MFSTFLLNIKGWNFAKLCEFFTLIIIFVDKVDFIDNILNYTTKMRNKYDIAAQEENKMAAISKSEKREKK